MTIRISIWLFSHWAELLWCWHEEKWRTDFRGMQAGKVWLKIFWAACQTQMCIRDRCFTFSGQSINYVIFELMSRLSRNAFIVLALIIPIVAGMGINFAITIGAMASQIAMLWVLEWQVPGIGGFLLAALLTAPIAGFFGLLIGNLLNKMKGQEMIGGMILGLSLIHI